VFKSSKSLDKLKFFQLYKINRNLNLLHALIKFYRQLITKKISEHFMIIIDINNSIQWLKE